MSTLADERIAEGLALLRDIQLYYEPVITEENLPYVAAASIISGGPFFNFVEELDELMESIEAALRVVVSIRDATDKWRQEAIQREINENT